MSEIKVKLLEQQGQLCRVCSSTVVTNLNILALTIYLAI